MTARKETALVIKKTECAQIDKTKSTECNTDICGIIKFRGESQRSSCGSRMGRSKSVSVSLENEGVYQTQQVYAMSILTGK